MAVKLMNLRNVPVDELVEIYDLLDCNAIEYYETTAGTFGISLAALWLRDESQLEKAKSLLDEYAEQRLASARVEFENLRNAGKARSFADFIKENPLRFVLSTALVFALLYISVAPFLKALEVIP
ncbi:MAG: DUF6164 family protein [Pseudomonadota bacterium]